MTSVKSASLEKVLVSRGLLDPAELEQRRGLSSRYLLENLATAGVVDPSEVAGALAEEFQLPFVSLTGTEIDRGATCLISRETAMRYGVLPLAFDDGSLVVATADPTRLNDFDDLRVITGYPIKPVVCPVSELSQALRQYPDVDAVIEDALASVADTEADVTDVGELKEGRDAPVVKLVNFVVQEAVKRRAGDIHIEPGEDLVRIRYRIDGVLQEAFTFPKTTQAGMVSRLKIMGKMDIAERRLPQDGRFQIEGHKQPIDVRVASLPTVHGEKMVLRLLEKGRVQKDIGELGFAGSNKRRLDEMLDRPHGAILVAGPTGSGKTTTLYAALAGLNSEERNIITVEDPVEYRLAGINQVQVARRAGLTFATGLRSILRNDPDTVMVGEIRDKETAVIAVEAALTGHLVLSTIHTNDAASTALRLTEMGVEPFLVASSVAGVVAQRLARRLCGHCRRPRPTIEGLPELLAPHLQDVGRVYEAGGCPECSGTGYLGRVAVAEVLVVTEQIAALIAESAPSEQVKQAASEEGMVSLVQDGAARVRTGETSISEILRVIE